MVKSLARMARCEDVEGLQLKTERNGDEGFDVTASFRRERGSWGI